MIEDINDISVNPENGNSTKPLLPAGRIIQQKLNLKNKCKHKF